MRETLLAILLVASWSAWAQPANDDCDDAITLNLSDPGGCPDGDPAIDIFDYDNIGATPTVPYPSFIGCEGGANDAPAAEVWFYFESKSSIMSFAVTGGLQIANAVLFSGEDCGFLSPVACARGDTITGELSFFTDVNAGQPYYLMLSGSDLADQDNFSLEVKTFPDCDNCQDNNEFIVSPPPINGTYAAGQEVQVCFNINNWDVETTQEWLHSVVFEFGPGWDQSTIVPDIPASCDGEGQWGWYNSWEGNTTGDFYGPGFAYDSQIGGPLDGNPGNNWGDGAEGCDQIGSIVEPRSFCFRIRVAACTPNPLNNSLYLRARVFSDGQTGSWFQTGCNNGREGVLIATAICCNDFDPAISNLQPTTCREFSDGSFTFIGSGGMSPGPWNYTVLDRNNTIVYQADGQNGANTVTGLPGGQYSVVAVNILTNCFRSALVDLPNGPPPPVTAENTGPYCRWADIELMGNTTATGSNITYTWTGPNGYTSNQQNPADAAQEGDYTLVVEVDGCFSDPVTTTVEFIEDDVTAQPVPPACPSLDSLIDLSQFLIGTPPANGVWKELSAVPSTGAAFDPSAGTFNPFGQAPGEYAFALLPASGDPCSADPGLLNVSIQEPPTADAGPDQLLTCDAPMVTIGGDSTSAGGGITYAWTYSGSGNSAFDTGRRTVSVSQPGSYTLLVTDAIGCTATDSMVVDSDTDVPVMDIRTTDITCFGLDNGSISVVDITSGDPPYEISLDGNVFGEMRQFGSLGPGIYDLVVRDAKGCESSANVEIVEPEQLVVKLQSNLEPPFEIKLGESVILEAIYNPNAVLSSLLWTTDGRELAQNQVFLEEEPLITTTYGVRIVDENGCEAGDELTILVDREIPLFMPNAFSPNDDGNNDYYFPFAGDQVIRVLEFRIFNRWGAMVFEAPSGVEPNGPQFGWDGTFNGKEAPVDSYIYAVEVELVDGTSLRRGGDFMLLR